MFHCIITINNMLTKSLQIIDIYIPRILGDVSANTVKNAFKTLNIGNVIDLDMHKKKNENGYYYFFAFIKLQVWNTTAAAKITNCLNERSIVHVVYDEEACQYWEIKKHIPRNIRKEQSIIGSIATSTKNYIDNIAKQLIESNEYVSGLTQQDRLDMITEYKELEREIFQLTC